MRTTNVLRMGRVEASIPCKVVSTESSSNARITSFAVDLLALVLQPGVVREGDPVKVRVEMGGEAFEIDGMVASLGQAAEGLERCKVRVADRSTRQRSVALELLERVLQSPAPGRRRCPRVEKRVGVTCVAHEQFDASMVNISREGLAIEGRLPIKQGDVIEVRIAPLSFPHKLVLSGTVVYVRRLSDTESRAGVRLEGLYERQLKVLDAYIRMLMRGK
ncbi:MAG: PilZ domain-containing protein [Myxococcales bacterium]|jgi:hypothetical protein